MSQKLKVALVQMTSGPEVGPNIDAAAALIRKAAADGAAFVLTPENTTLIEPNKAHAFAKSCVEAEHPGVPRFAALARELKIWLLVGSMTIRVEEGKLANRSFLFDPDGKVVARYDKIHLFDVDLPSGETYRESNTIRPGAQAVVAETPWGGIGLTICYDLRFAYLHRALAQAGAAIITVPAAFTVPTGKAHWETLLRARAIETGSFVLAPAQCGEHADGRRTYGHSLIIAPWGEVLAEAGETPGIVAAELDLAEVAKARSMIPALQHDRVFAKPQPMLRAAGE
jgi:deaminated glutathione amidase